MQSETSSPKSIKGSVVVINSHNRLQLRFRFGGKRRYRTYLGSWERGIIRGKCFIQAV